MVLHVSTYIGLLGACLLFEAGGKLLNIALHAQVAPSGNQVVGSVITTDGLKAALRMRDDVGEVKIFYPFHYDGLTESVWDVIIIEGWFPMIHDFLQIARSIASHPTVLFYCLDPSYPGMNDISTYDVDGYLTNSRSLQKKLEKSFPGRVEYVMLAADPEVMVPNASVSRASNVLYLGAGGRMIEYKPVLLEMIRAAAPYGLTLYGMGWEEIDDATIQAAYKGVLPRYEIARAYSSAIVVLASTIEAQRAEGMINNRIFEAMSCGAVVLSDHSEALEEFSEGTVLFYRNRNDVAKWLGWTKENPQEALKIGQRSRDLILAKHTWAHRAVSILGLVADLASTKAVNRRCCDRPNCPTMLWVIASNLEDHVDYNAVLASHVYAGICRDYKITISTEDEFIGYLHSPPETPSDIEKPLNQFESIMLILSPFDRLDVNVRKHFLRSGFRREVAKQHDKGYGRLQKWNALYLGINAGARRTWDLDSYRDIFHEALTFARQANREQETAQPWLSAQLAEVLRFDMYDLLLFRSKAEIDDFRTMFNVQNNDAAVSDDPCGFDAMRCELLFSTSEVIIQEASPTYRSPLVEYTRNEGHRKGKAQAPWSKDPESNQFKTKRTLEEERRTKSVDDKIQAKKRDPEPILVICFWPHAELCTQTNRKTLIGDDSVKDDDFRILLLGGSFDEWLSLPDTLDYSYMHRVTHVGRGQRGLPAMSLFDNIKRVYLMHGDEQSHQQPFCDLRRIVSSLLTSGAGDTVKDGEYCSAYDDTTFWPLALAAKSGASISTWAANDILLSSAKTGLLDRWGGEHLITMLQRSVCKAHGLGSGASSIVVSPVGMSHFLVAGEEYSEELLNSVQSVKQEHVDLDLTRDERQGMLSTPMTGLRDAKAAIVGDLSVIVRLDTANFVPGRDGDVCFQVLLPYVQWDRLNMTQSPNTMRYPTETEVNAPRACLLRLDHPFVLLNITLLYRQPPALHDNESQISLSQLARTLSLATLEVYARGNMFADTVDSMKTSFAPFLEHDGNVAFEESGVNAGDVNVLDLEVML